MKWDLLERPQEQGEQKKGVGEALGAGRPSGAPSTRRFDLKFIYEAADRTNTEI